MNEHDSYQHLTEVTDVVGCIRLGTRESPFHWIVGQLDLPIKIVSSNSNQ